MALTVITSGITSITNTTASGGGFISSSITGATLTARGVVWNTSPSPTTGNSKTTNGTSLGAFTSSLTGLQPNSMYYVRAYATSGGVSTYGNQVTFTTPVNVIMTDDQYNLWAKIGYVAGITPTDAQVAAQLAYLAAEAVINEQP